MAITKDMTIQEVVENNPETIRVFLEHGLHCIGCAVARFENIEQGALAHGIDVDALINDLNTKAGDNSGDNGE
jgi:hybrid cluster-associated redox disulfide protein